MQRWLGIDYGTRRIGIAIGDSETRIAMPVTCLDGRNDVTRDARNVADLGAEHGVDGFVVGVPINMDDTDGAQTTLTRRFASELGRLSRKPVELFDERLSSFAASEALSDAGIKPTRKSGRLDAVAAQKILQGYLDGLPQSDRPNS